MHLRTQPTNLSQIYFKAQREGVHSHYFEFYIFQFTVLRQESKWNYRKPINKMRQNCFMASVDIYRTLITPSRPKNKNGNIFVFLFQGVKYQFTALVIGYSCRPRL